MGIRSTGTARHGGVCVRQSVMNISGFLMGAKYVRFMTIVLGDRYLNLLAQNPKRERIGRIGRNQVIEGEYIMG